tara:strand:- start:222 stop:413 length:192 start_codon:yes stop_codon:yes gene_type:complete
MTNKIKLKKYQPFFKTTGSIYKYKNWHIEDTGINWTARKGNERSYQFQSLKDVRNFLYNEDIK